MRLNRGAGPRFSRTLPDSCPPEMHARRQGWEEVRSSRAMPCEATACDPLEEMDANVRDPVGRGRSDRAVVGTISDSRLEGTFGLGVLCRPNVLSILLLVESSPVATQFPLATMADHVPEAASALRHLLK